MFVRCAGRGESPPRPLMGLVGNAEEILQLFFSEIIHRVSVRDPPQRVVELREFPVTVVVLEDLMVQNDDEIGEVAKIGLPLFEGTIERVADRILSEGIGDGEVTPEGSAETILVGIGVGISLRHRDVDDHCMHDRTSLPHGVGTAPCVCP